MKKFLTLLALISITTFASNSEPYTHTGYTSVEIMKLGEKAAKEIKWVTVDDIKNSLKDTKPITVSFDIDDTVLASSGCFLYGEKNFKTEKYQRFTKNPKFWDFIDEKSCDSFSIPKNVSKELIQMHLDRGDTVIFITGRTASKNYSQDKLDSTAMILQKEFGIVNMKAISYRTPETKAANKYDKTYYIKKYNVALHYGDSDDDILAAKESGIRGIRILRATNSNNTHEAKNGGYGEEVLLDSFY